MNAEEAELGLIKLLRMDATALEKLKTSPLEPVYENYTVLNALQNCCFALAQIMEDLPKLKPDW